MTKSRLHRYCVSLLCLLFFLLAFHLVGVAQAISVCEDGCDFNSIMAAITDSNTKNGDTIVIGPGTYREAVDLNVRSLQLNLVSATGPDETIIDGSDNPGVSVVEMAGDTLVGFTVRNGAITGMTGGGIRAYGSRISNCIIENNTTDFKGGGIFASDTTISNTVIRNNSAREGGGAYIENSGKLIDSQVLNNTAAGGTAYAGKGGGVYLDGSVIENSSFSGNKVQSQNAGNISGGGGIYASYYSKISNTEVTGNTVNAPSSNVIAGGVYLSNTDFLGGRVSGNSLSGSSNTYGAGIYISAGPVIMQGVEVSGNTGSSRGGGVYIASTNKEVRVTGARISANQASDDGGGIYCYSSTVLDFFSGTNSGNTINDFSNACRGCVEGAQKTCSTLEAGICATGIQTCSSDQVWGACLAENEPGPEDCLNQLDDDCDGITDAADLECIQTPPTTVAESPYSGNAADPVNTFTGELFFHEKADLAIQGPMPLIFRRYYASGLETLGRSGSMGRNWRHNFDMSLVKSGSTLTITGQSGARISFTLASSAWTLSSASDIPYQLKESLGSYLLADPMHRVLYVFDSNGRLTSVENTRGSVLAISYSGNLPATISDGLGRNLTLTHDNNGRVTGVSDGSRSVTYSYDANGDLTSFTDAAGNITTFTYDASGRLTAKILPRANTPYSQTYDGNGRVASQTDALGNTVNFAYNDSIGMTQMTRPLASSGLQLHGSGRLISYAGSDGHKVYTAYGADGRPFLLLDRLQDRTRTTYHAESGRVASRTEADGAVTRYFYTPLYYRGLLFYGLKKISHPDGSTTGYSYSYAGALVKRTDRNGSIWSMTANTLGQPLTITSPTGALTSFTYTSDGALASRTDGTGATVSFSYDAVKRLTALTFADTSSISFTYDASDNLLTETDGRGNSRTYTYDVNGNLASIALRTGEISTFAYDAMDRISSIADPGNNTFTLHYDALGRVDMLTDREGKATHFSHDAMDRLSGITDASGRTWQRSYDREGVLNAVLDPSGRATTYTSDALGRFSQIVDPRQAATKIVYDASGNPGAVTDPTGRITAYGYDGGGRLASMTVGARASTYARNLLGQIEKVTDPRGQEWSRGYDASGRLLAATDPLGNTIAYTYNAMNRVSSITFPASLGSLAITYNANGRMIRKQYSDGTDLQFTRDAEDRITDGNALSLRYDQMGRLAESNGILIGRDKNGRIVSMQFAEGKTVTYVYDASGRLTSVSDWAGGLTTFTYDGNGRLAGMTRPNGLTTSRLYDPAGNLAVVNHGGQGEIVMSRDLAGRITATKRTVPQAGAYSSPAGMSATFNAASQPEGSAFDALGRKGSEGGTLFTWDLASRLVSYGTDSGAVTMTYDGLGMRTARTQGGVTQNAVWNYSLALPSISIFSSDETVRQYNIHTPDGLLLHSINAADNSRRFYHFDETGNTLFLSNDSGMVRGSYAYGPYGELLSADPAPDNPFTWQGQYGVVREPDSVLYYMRSRYYAAGGGRFLSRDPIQTIGPLTVNPFQYAAGDPLLFHDPLGLLGTIIYTNEEGIVTAKWVEYSDMSTDNVGYKNWLDAKEADIRTRRHLVDMDYLLREQAELAGQDASGLDSAIDDLQGIVVLDNGLAGYAPPTPLHESGSLPATTEMLPGIAIDSVTEDLLNIESPENDRTDNALPPSSGREAPSKFFRFEQERQHADAGH